MSTSGVARPDGFRTPLSRIPSVRHTARGHPDREDNRGDEHVDRRIGHRDHGHNLDRMADSDTPLVKPLYIPITNTAKLSTGMPILKVTLVTKFNK